MGNPQFDHSMMTSSFLTPLPCAGNARPAGPRGHFWSRGESPPGDEMLHMVALRRTTYEAARDLKLTIKTEKGTKMSGRIKETTDNLCKDMRAGP